MFHWITVKTGFTAFFFCCRIPVTARWLCCIHRFVQVLRHSRSVSSLPLFRSRMTFLLVWSNSLKNVVYLCSSPKAECLPSWCHSRDWLLNNLACFTRPSGVCSISMFKFRNSNVQYNDSANHLINSCRVNVLWLFTLRDQVFSSIQVSLLRGCPRKNG